MYVCVCVRLCGYDVRSTNVPSLHHLLLDLKTWWLPLLGLNGFRPKGAQNWELIVFSLGRYGMKGVDSQESDWKQINMCIYIYVCVCTLYIYIHILYSTYANTYTSMMGKCGRNLAHHFRSISARIFVGWKKHDFSRGNAPSDSWGQWRSAAMFYSVLWSNRWSSLNLSLYIE